MKKNLLLLSLLFIIATITSEARRLTPTEALARISTTGPAKARAAIAQTPRLAARDSISDTYYIFSTAEQSLKISPHFSNDVHREYLVSLNCCLGSKVASAGESNYM